MYSRQLAYVLDPHAATDARLTLLCAGPKPHRSAADHSGRITVEWEEFGLGEHSRKRFVCTGPASWVRVTNTSSVFLEVLALSPEGRSFCNSSIAHLCQSRKRMASKRRFRRPIRSPTSKNGGNSCTYQDKSSTTSTRFEKRS